MKNIDARIQVRPLTIDDGEVRYSAAAYLNGRLKILKYAEDSEQAYFHTHTVFREYLLLQTIDSKRV